MKTSTHSAIPNKSTLSQLWKLSKFVSTRRKYQLCLLSLLMIVAAISEVVTVNSVAPFLKSISNPGDSNTIQLPFDFISSLGENSNYNPLLFSSILFGCAAIISGSLRLITIWFSGKLASAIGSDLSCLVYKHTLYQPTSFIFNTAALKLWPSRH